MDKSSKKNSLLLMLINAMNETNEHNNNWTISHILNIERILEKPPNLPESFITLANS